MQTVPKSISKHLAVIKNCTFISKRRLSLYKYLYYIKTYLYKYIISFYKYKLLYRNVIFHTTLGHTEKESVLFMLLDN